MANKRLYYAVKQVGIQPDGSSTVTPIFGAQDLTIGTNFNLTQIFEIGQLAIYQSIEDLPDVEISVSKIFDGKPLIWHLATTTATAGPDLAGRSNEKCDIYMSTFSDDLESATGTPEAVVQCKDTYPRTISYNFTADGSAFSESVTFVGNDKIFSTDTKILNTDAQTRRDALGNDFDGAFSGNNDTPLGIERQSELLFAYTAPSGTPTDVNGAVRDSDATILPQDVDGISASGTNELTSDEYGCHVQSISLSTDLGREEIPELGRRGPFHRYATFPVEVTCSIEVLSQRGDNISATEEGIYTTGSDCDATASNLKDRTIRLATCGGVRIYLGTKNRLSSVDFGGGTTDGGNDTNTYNFTNFNDLTVMAEYDPNSNAATWWTNRDTYLLD